MPIYAWNCALHGEFESFYKMADKPKQAPCPDCGAESRQVLTIGGVEGDELPPWFRHEHARGCLQSSGEKPIESRSEYKKYLRDRGIVESSANREF